MSDKDRQSHLIELLKAKAAEILPLGSRLSLYGSRARGDTRADSDWDLHILIHGEEKLPWTIWDKYAWPLELIGIENNEEVNVRIYSFSGWLKRKFLPFYKNVENDAVILYQN